MIHIVLYEPEIPQNTGNILRTCMAFDMKLHLIEPLGFYMDEKHLRRAGMDYIKDTDFTLWPDWDTFTKQNHGAYFYSTRYGRKAPDSFDFSEIKDDIYLIFGKESTGIPKEILRKDLDHCMRIPMNPAARSLNLSNCVAIVAYEVLSQRNYEQLSSVEVIKGADWLEQ
ncbi:MAG: tRNA (cytidine(34)-2'-O)-methyltransferase [Solobacterium sp.]|nr:tRNA (cytidine(34)-2'-O)-methyltransferase [Solobacterium sp.]